MGHVVGLERPSEAYELRGVAYTNQRRLDRALADYDKAIKLKPVQDVSLNLVAASR
ncbi:Flp pilus assembly protein TadD [Bradyrhizobium sp. GM24.11]